MLSFSGTCYDRRNQNEPPLQPSLLSGDHRKSMSRVADVLWGTLIVGGKFVAVTGALLVRRWAPVEVLERHNEVAGFIYSVIGVMYAVLLGFTAIIRIEPMNPRLIRFAASMESGMASQSPVPRRSRTVRSLLDSLLMPHSMRVSMPSSQGDRRGRKEKAVPKH